MTTLFAQISMSLDGYVAGPNPTLDEPLGEGGEQLHEWAFALKEWREPHGREGGDTNASSEVVAQSLERTGAAIIGRRMFSGGAGPWEDDPNANGWWGDEPPFDHPIFVLTHHERDPLTLGGTTFTFVTGGIESALDQARDAAAGKDVGIGGGGQAIQQYLRAGLLDELHVQVAPVMLGGGVRLFEDTGRPDLELIGAVDAPGVTHLSYRVLK
jgi:dihydrofolate reductase